MPTGIVDPRDLLEPSWALPALGAAAIVGSFGYAGQTLVFRAPSFFVAATVYVVLQVIGWILVIEWIRLSWFPPSAED